MPPVQNSSGSWTGRVRPSRRRSQRPPRGGRRLARPQRPEEREHLVHQRRLVAPATPVAPFGLSGKSGTKVVSSRPGQDVEGASSLANRTGLRPGRSIVVPSLRWRLWAAAKDRPASGSKVGAEDFGQPDRVESQLVEIVDQPAKEVASSVVCRRPPRQCAQPRRTPSVGERARRGPASPVAGHDGRRRGTPPRRYRNGGEDDRPLDGPAAAGPVHPLLD